MHTFGTRPSSPNSGRPAQNMTARPLEGRLERIQLLFEIFTILRLHDDYDSMIFTMAMIATIATIRHVKVIQYLLPRLLRESGFSMCGGTNLSRLQHPIPK